jgi:hypothetical protein
MERHQQYIRISELLDMAKRGPSRPIGKCAHALSLIEETLIEIEAMSIAEREDLMKRIAGWVLIDKFSAKGYSALSGLQRYCIAECLLEDPNWSPSQAGTKPPPPWEY